MANLRKGSQGNAEYGKVVDIKMMHLIFSHGVYRFGSLADLWK